MKKIITAVLSIILCFGLVACGGSDNDSASEKNDNTYKGIYENYSKQMQDIVPDLINEFKAESSDESNDSTDIEIYMEKIKKLAKINSDGIYKMAELLNKELTEENEAECDEYGEKLTQVYDECEKEVSDGCGIE